MMKCAIGESQQQQTERIKKLQRGWKNADAANSLTRSQAGPGSG